MNKIFCGFVSLLLFASCNNNSNTEANLKLIPVQSGKYWGFIDHYGVFKINPQFNKANPFYEGLALVQSTDGKFGFINENGNYAINSVYKDASDFSDGLALVVKEDSKPEFINAKGETKITLDATVEKAHGFSEGMALININNKYGYINDEGKIVIPAIYQYAYDFSEGLALVGEFDSTDNAWKYGFIDKKGTLAINYQFKSASLFKNGLALMYNGSKYGYIDKDGKIVINPQFDQASLFFGDFAIIKQGELWGYIDKKGKYVINPQFKFAGFFYDNGLANVESIDGKFGFIDKQGKYVINSQFDLATRFYDNFSIVAMGGKYGLIDKSGKIIVNPQFESFNAGLEYKNWIVSDFFEPNNVVAYINDSLTDRSFNGFSSSTRAKDIKALYPNINENNYSYFQDFIPNENRYVRLQEISTEYNNLFINSDNYIMRQVYDPVAGGYTNQKVYAGSTRTLNLDAPLTSISFCYILKDKAKDKKLQILNAFYNKCKAAGMTDYAFHEGGFYVNNKNITIACGLHAVVGFDICVTAIFNTKYANSQTDTTTKQ